MISNISSKAFAMMELSLFETLGNHHKQIPESVKVSVVHAVCLTRCALEMFQTPVEVIESLFFAAVNLIGSPFSSACLIEDARFSRVSAFSSVLNFCSRVQFMINGYSYQANRLCQNPSLAKSILDDCLRRKAQEPWILMHNSSVIRV
ncbi:MAG: hypothetical protein V4492_00720 [Chlamydiota bacterium]